MFIVGLPLLPRYTSSYSHPKFKPINTIQNHALMNQSWCKSAQNVASYSTPPTKSSDFKHIKRASQTLLPPGSSSSTISTKSFHSYSSLDRQSLFSYLLSYLPTQIKPSISFYLFPIFWLSTGLPYHQLVLSVASSCGQGMTTLFITFFPLGQPFPLHLLWGWFGPD